jgi:hypothetical protein
MFCEQLNPSITSLEAALADRTMSGCACRQTRKPTVCFIQLNLYLVQLNLNLMVSPVGRT